MKHLLAGAIASQLIIATVLADDAIEHKTYKLHEHKTYKLLREGVLASEKLVEVANFSYHEHLQPTVAAGEFNLANCQIVANFFTDLTGQDHWCEQGSLSEFESFK